VHPLNNRRRRSPPRRTYVNGSSKTAAPKDAIRSQTVARVLSALGKESLGARFSRYTAGSIVAFAVSEAALIFLFGTGLVGAAAASVLAFVAGAIPNYFLNRSWVWNRRGRISVRHELAPYVLVSVATLAVAAIATSAAAAIAPSGRGAQTVFVAMAYLATYGALFVAKFAVYHRLIFTDGGNPGAAQ
jgi:putative flippase GtrA